MTSRNTINFQFNWNVRKW